MGFNAFLVVSGEVRGFLNPRNPLENWNLSESLWYAPEATLNTRKAFGTTLNFMERLCIPLKSPRELFWNASESLLKDLETLWYVLDTLAFKFPVSPWKISAKLRNSLEHL